MADIARAALPLIGYYFFGPVGALVGGLLADVLFPLPGVKGPRLNELNIQTSTVGAPIPIVYGTAALAGNVIWSSGLIETKHEDEQGGFIGIGGQTVTTYSYSVDVAVGICEGPISAIRRIWADANLIYDASSDDVLARRLAEIQSGPGTEETWEEFVEAINIIRAMSSQLAKEVYLGTEDQLPDPTIESYEGVGLVPGFRGLAYIVMTGFQLEKYGNRIPNFRFEVTTAGTPTECGLYSAGNLLPWVFDPNSSDFDFNTWDPRSRFNNHTYGWVEGGDSVIYPMATAVANMEAGYSGRNFLISEAAGKDYANNIYIQGWSTSTTPNYIRPCDDGTNQPNGDYVTVQLSLNSIHQQASERYDCTGMGGDPAPIGGYCATVLEYAVKSYYDGQLSGFYARTDDNDVAAANDLFEGVTTAQGLDAIGDCGGSEPVQRWRLVDAQLAVRRTLLPPDPCLFGTPLAGAPGWCVFNGEIRQQITWTTVAGTFRSLQEYTQTGPFGVVTKYPVNPCIRNDDPNYSNQDFWEAAYADALAEGEPIAPGLVYGVDYPATQSFAYFSECETVDAVCVPMAVIVADICRRAGLRTDTSSQIDVSGLTTCVDGYIIGRQMSGRDALGPLRAYGLWDAVESQAILKFVERGAALVDTLSADDLGAHEAGSQAPSAVEVSRVQEKDLPRRLRLHFANFLHDHEPSEQSASRLSTEAVNELDVELPISMEPDTAAQLAEIMLYEAYVSRNTYRLALDNTWLALEPTDCVEIPVDGQTQRVRIVSVDYSIGGIARIEAVADDDGTYTSTAVATPGTPSGGVPGQGGSALICPSGLVLLDIPRLATGHIDAGYYAAIYNTCGDDGWECAELYRSNDGGLTYGRVARTNGETTVGEIDSITGPATDPTLPGDSPAYDTTSSITVTLFEGTLASITDAQIAAGQNLAAVGVDGRWVIIQFKTATFDTGDQYTLTDLIWGVNGTEHLLGTTVDGDTFVLLSDSDLLRIPESADAIGVEKQFKIVTCGEAVDAVTPIDFTTWGLSYLRLCPSNVISASLTEPPNDPTHGDSYLLPNDTSLAGLWADHGGQIATWSDETDNWVYCTPAPGTIIHVGGDSSDPGDDVISGGDGTTTPAPWTPAIPPLVEEPAPDPDTSYLVIYTEGGYRKILMADAGTGGGGFPTTDTSDIGIALDELTDVVISTPAEDDVLMYTGTGGWQNMPLSSVPGSGGTVVQAFQANQSSSATNAALTTSELSVVLATGRWWIEMVIFTTSNATADFQDRYNFSGTANTSQTIARVISAGAANPVMNDTAINSTALAFNTTTNNRTMVMGTLDVSASGTFSYQFSQQTLSAPNPVFVQIGSYLRATKIS